MLDHPYLRLTYIKTTESRCFWSATSPRLCQFSSSWKDLKRTERRVKRWIFYGSIKIASRLLLQEHSRASRSRSKDSPPILSLFLDPQKHQKHSGTKWQESAKNVIPWCDFTNLLNKVLQIHIIYVSGDLHLHHNQNLSNWSNYKYNQPNFTVLIG